MFNKKLTFMKNARKSSLWKGCLVPFFQVNRSSFPTIGGFKILVGVFYAGHKINSMRKLPTFHDNTTSFQGEMTSEE